MQINLEDPYLVDKIVGEVKSQGVFDQFRRDCMSDVDTKPAYQNLRQRVEISVGKFLSEQIWTSDTNKIQLREKLRKHVTEAGFLDTGVERIVDQVVNPKISTIFQPKIEDIAYKYLGIEKPPEKIDENLSTCTNGNLLHEIDLMPKDLEAVSSPESSPEKSPNKLDVHNDTIDSEEKDEEEESPPFEPLEGRPPSVEKEESIESKLSAISGLTSQDSIKNEEDKPFSLKPLEECQLSQVSSNSHLSIVTTEEEEFENSTKQQPENDMSEEAQMPKFFENSDLNETRSFNFDIKRDEIKFEGTERTSVIQNLTEKNDVQIEMDSTETHQSEITLHHSSSELQNSLTDDNDSDKALKIMTDVSQSGSVVLSIADQIDKNEENSKNDNQNKPQSPSSTWKFDNNKKEDTEKKKSKQSNFRDPEKRKSKNHEYDTESSSHSSSREHRTSRKDKHRSSSSYKHKSGSHHRKQKSSESEKETDSKSKRAKEAEEKINDDHYSAKLKLNRRKSTDSNDGDNIKDGHKSSTTTYPLSTSSTECANNSKSLDSSCNHNSDVDDKKTHSIGSDKQKLHSNLKPVILDELLNNNNVHCIELTQGDSIECKNKFQQINHKIDFQESEKCENIDEENIFVIDPVEEENIQLKMKKLSDSIENNLKYCNAYLSCDKNFIEIFKSLSIKIIEIEKINVNSTNLNSSKESSEKKFVEYELPGKATNYIKNNDIETIVNTNYKRKLNGRTFTNNKRAKLLDDNSIYSCNDTVTSKCSTINDRCNEITKSTDEIDSNKKIKSSSINLETLNSSHTIKNVSCKENDFLTTINSEKLCKSIKNEKITISSKNNQRYSSEDLYKPRPILNQRSKRRGMNTCNF